jgi:hypothetical protein
MQSAISDLGATAFAEASVLSTARDAFQRLGREEEVKRIDYLLAILSDGVPLAEADPPIEP